MASEISSRHKLNLERMLLDASAEPTYLPLSLLEDITNCFSDDEQIGSGGFAMVYKGTTGKGIVAVKKLFQTLDMHENKFHKEVECLTKAKHKNIVRFLGYCSDTQGRIAEYEGKFVMADLRNWLLCFEYMPNGSLDMYITDASRGLEWGERYQLIKGICEGLYHLHEKRILHLDLKPSNILIDDRMVPKIADFGLARCLDKDQTRDFTSHLCGSQGYLAPEFYRGQVAFASDIYSLGVIIVEILTGEKGYPEDEKVVDNWMNRLEASNKWEIQLEQVRVCTKIGIECMDLDPKKRPVALYIIDRLDETWTETSMTGSTIEEQVSFVKEQYREEKTIRFSSEYLRKDIKECVELEELMEYVETTREDHWQQGQQEEHMEKEELAEFAETIREDHWQQGQQVQSFETEEITEYAEETREDHWQQGQKEEHVEKEELAEFAKTIRGYHWQQGQQEQHIKTEEITEYAETTREDHCQQGQQKQRVQTEELAEYAEKTREYHCQQGQQDAPDDQWSLCRAQDTKIYVGPQGARISGSLSGLLYKLNSLDIFNRKVRRNYVRCDGPTLEKIRSVKLFKKGELKPILKDKNFIRKDGFGDVYKGLVENVPVTVRKLISGTVPNHGIFAHEIIMQSQVNHKNIIRFLGCCLEFDVPLLVHEFLPTVSLHDILHINIRVPLNLGVRLSIAATLASTLAYMHSMANITLLHGDLKPANILFDVDLSNGNFEPKISGFGMPRITTEHIFGDMAYMDPVYLQTELMTEQSDVYSFGVVILELLTRKKAAQVLYDRLLTNFIEDRNMGRKSTELFDKEIVMMGDLELLYNLAEIAVECVNLDAAQRPTMVDVAKRLSILNQSRRQVVS